MIQNVYSRHEEFAQDLGDTLVVSLRCTSTVAVSVTVSRPD